MIATPIVHKLSHKIRIGTSVLQHWITDHNCSRGFTSHAQSPPLLVVCLWLHFEKELHIWWDRALWGDSAVSGTADTWGHAVLLRPCFLDLMANEFDGTYFCLSLSMYDFNDLLGHNSHENRPTLASFPDTDVLFLVSLFCLLVINPVSFHVSEMSLFSALFWRW
jgi:hypothetical protein